MNSYTRRYEKRASLPIYGEDRYGWYAVIDGFRSAMPDRETAARCAYSEELLGALKALLGVCTEHMNSTVTPQMAQASMAINRAEGRL